MIKDFIRENEDNVISFVTFAFIIIATIIIIYMWITNVFSSKSKEPNIDTFESVSYQEVMQEEYKGLLNRLLRISNSESLYKVLDENYRIENGINEENYKSYLISNKYIGNSIEIISSSFSKNDECCVFTYYYKNASNYNYVSLIEYKPGFYKISFEKEVSKVITGGSYKSGSSNGIAYELNLIDFTEENVTFNIKLTNYNVVPINIDFNDINSFTLRLNDRYIALGGIVASDVSDLLPNSSVTKELFFSLSNDEFKQCDKLLINNIKLNDEYVTIDIDL